MSASEMICFLSHLGLMIGFLVPEGNDHWNLFVTLLKILHIIMDKTTIPENTLLLKSLISEHHYIYCILLKQELKPKHHNMIHYPRILNQVGPLVHTWSMRFEARHRPSKVTASVSCSRKNICYTLAIKSQLQMCYRFLTCSTFDIIRTKLGPAELIDSRFYRYNGILSDKSLEFIESYKWLKYMGICFKKQSSVIIKIEELPVFGKILDFVTINGEPHIIYEQMVTLCFKEHIQAFEIMFTETINIIKVKELCTIACHTFTTCTDGKCYITKLSGI